MLWLYDSSRVRTGHVFEASSLVVTRRFAEHSEWRGRFPVSAYDALAAAAYAVPHGQDEVYLVERVTIGDDVEAATEYVEAGGRSCTALLHLRTIVGTMSWAAVKHGQIISDIIGSLSGGRAIGGLAFGTGASVGTPIDLQRSWGDMGEVVREVASAASLGLRARLSGTSILIDVFAAASSDALVGDEYGTGSSSQYSVDNTEWRNYAVVLGEVPEPTGIPATTKTLTNGSTGSGTSADIDDMDGTHWSIVEDAATGILLELVFRTLAGHTPGEISVRGYYTGSGTNHHIDLYGYNYDTGIWDLLVDGFMPGGGAAAADYTYSFGPIYVDEAYRFAKFRLQHHTATYNAAHNLVLDSARITMRAPRVRVDVDQRSGGALRELFIDARDIQRNSGDDTLSASEYAAVLAARGAEKLADTRRIEFAAVTLDAALNPGDVVWYDSSRWKASLMCTEATITTEGGMVKHSATLGEPPPRMRKTFRKMERGIR